MGLGEAQSEVRVKPRCTLASSTWSPPHHRWGLSGSGDEPASTAPSLHL